MGSTVSVEGYNFSGVGALDDEIVYIDFGNTQPVIEVRDEDFGGQPPGSFKVSFVIREQTVGGLLAVRARGSQSSPDATASFLYSDPESNLNLQIEGSNTSFTPSSSVTLVGTGYLPLFEIGKPSLKLATVSPVDGTKLLIDKDDADGIAITGVVYGQNTNSGRVTTDSDGKFKISFTLPANIPAGDYRVFINLEDADGDGVGDAENIVLASPDHDGIIGTPAADAVGNIPPTNGLDDTNWEVGDTYYTVYEDANKNGQLDYSQAYQTLTIIPKLTVTPSQLGKVGGTFTVSGFGFGNQEVVDVKLTDDNVELTAGTFPTDTDGSFSSSTFEINQQSFGPKKILARKKTTLLTAVGDETISVQNQVSSASSTVAESVYVGQTITLLGNGWGNNETITATITEFTPDGGTAETLDVVVAETTTQSDGSLSIDVLVPSFSNTGIFKIKVSGSISDVQTNLTRNGDLLSWNLQGSSTHPITDISPTSGTVGTTVSLKVNRGFASGGLFFGGAEIDTVAAGNNTTDAIVTFVIPESAAGMQTVKLGQHKNKKQR